MESLCTQDSENQQGVPEKSTFLKFQVYKSIWLFWTTLYPSKGLYWAIWIIWTVMDCWTISYNLFVWLVRKLSQGFVKDTFSGTPCIWKGGTNFLWPCFCHLKSGECNQMQSVSKNMRCHKEQIWPQFSKYWFQIKSAASHRLWANADLFWKRYFENCDSICF